VCSIAVTVTCMRTAEPLICRTYLMNKPVSDSNLPSPHYMHVIIQGAIEHSMPDSYVKKLQLIKHNQYQGRIKYDLRVLNELNSSQT